MTNWKTTAAGIGAFLTALGTAISATFDNDPTTDPNWAIVATALFFAVGLFFAKDKPTGN
jgi:uncharacterized membrane protein YhhN